MASSMATYFTYVVSRCRSSRLTLTSTRVSITRKNIDELFIITILLLGEFNNLTCAHYVKSLIIIFLENQAVNKRKKKKYFYEK